MFKEESRKLNQFNKLLLIALSIFLSLAYMSCLGETDSTNVDGDYIDGDIIDGDSDNGGNSADGVVSIELVPASESGFLPQQIVNLDLATFDGLLTVNDAVTYSGEIKPYAEAVVQLIPSDNDQNWPMIAGHPLPSSSANTTNLADDDTDTLHSVFSIAVTPGKYTRYIYPKKQSEYSPVVLPDALSITEDVDETHWLEQGHMVQGYVLDSEGQPLSNVSVVAYSSNPWRRSSIAVSGSNDVIIDGDEDLEMENDSLDADGNMAEDLSKGLFTFYLPTEPAVYSIVLESASGETMYPVLTINNALEVNVSSVVFNQDIELTNDNKLKLYYGDFEQVPCIISGSIKTNEKTARSVSNTRIVAKSSLIGSGTFEASAETDENGNYSVEVLPTSEDVPNSFYKVSVLTPSESLYAETVVSNIECESGEVTLDFILEKRLLISGVISDYNSNLLEGVQVQATKLASDTDSNVYVKSTTTDSLGQYSIAVDAGTYDFLFVPPADSNLGRSYLHDVRTSNNGEINRTLNPGQTFRGKVVDQRNVAVPWVYVEVYHERPNSGIAEPIGSGTTNEQGEFEIILP